ncbi:DUF3080 family protein [Thalassolituus sp. LLYu03]|uniref:DUF3080 family protein n=1 Tax=Thalassolituus sp. LLYu03 TaxID=3421656 RepID=UPI003D2874A5
MSCSSALCRARPGWRRPDLRIRWAALFLVAAVSLTACGNQAVNELDDYRQRVARVLDADAGQRSAVPRVGRYATVHNRLPTPHSSLNLLQLLSLDRCAIGQSVATKNSALGKVAADSQSLLTELALLRDGPACVALLNDGNPELAAKLAAALAAKDDARLRYWWNAWTTGKEWQQFIASAAQTLDWDDAQPAHAQNTLAALDFALLTGSQIQARQWPGADATEQHLQQLLLGESIGRWLASQSLLTGVLNDVANMLEQRQAGRPLCPVGRKTPQAEILQNVLIRRYAARVQPYLSQTDKLGKALLERIEGMAQLAGETPPAFNDWLAQVRLAHAEFSAANLRHVHAWQTTLRACGLMPGSD